MVARTADLMGVGAIGIGTTFARISPTAWSTGCAAGAGPSAATMARAAADAPGFPQMPEWFRDNRDFGRIAAGLRDVGFSAEDVSAVMGGNWARFFAHGFGPTKAAAKETSG
jgi:membrane dipeptidase